MNVTARTAMLLLAACAVVAARPAAAVDLFVKPAGSGGTCAQSSPCTLATALATASADDRVLLAGGVYTGPGTEVVLLDKAVALLGGWSGAPSGEVARDPVAYESVIDGQGARRGVKITSGAALLDGVTVRNGDASGQRECATGQLAGCGGGILVTGWEVTVSHCRIESNTADSTVPAEWAVGLGGGIAGAGANSLQITGNTITGNVGSALNAGQGGGIALVGCSDARIAGNRIVGNTASLSGSLSCWGGGIALEGSGARVEVEDNLLLGNRAGLAGFNTMGNSLYTWYYGAQVVRNLMTSDSVGSAVVLGNFWGTFSGNTVRAGQEDLVVHLFNAQGEAIALDNNTLVAGPGTAWIVDVDGFVESPVQAVMRHNTIVGNGDCVGVHAEDYGNATLSNTIVVQTSPPFDAMPLGSIVADSTLLWWNTSEAYTGANAVHGDPLFVNRALGDFRIAPGSAAVDAGIDAGVAADTEGDPRPGCGGFDLGADELAPRHFDFGTAASPVQPPYTRVDHSSAYTVSSGYGWTSGSIASRDRAAGGDLQRDLCFTHDGSFAVDLPHGAYRVTVTMGDATVGHGQMAVFLEGVQQAVVSVAANDFRVLPFTVAVSDGQLNLELLDLGGSDPNVVINAMVIEPALPVRVDFGTASSPIASGYVRGTHLSGLTGTATFGWLGGAVQSRDRGTADPLLRDLAFSPRALLGFLLGNGLYDLTLTLGDAAAAHDRMGVAAQGSPLASLTTAKNGFATRTWRTGVADHALHVLLDDLGGSDANVVVNAVEVARSPHPFFDFGTPTSPVATGYVPVTHLTRYADGRGYGWTAGTVQSRNRAVDDDLLRDLVFSSNAEFAVDVVCGHYQVKITLGDAAAMHDQVGIYLEGELRTTVTTRAPGWATSTYSVTVRDGRLDVQLLDLGGSDAYAAINALEIR